MHVTLDNMFAFLVLLLILVTFMGYIIPTAYLSFTMVREHQLEEVAQAIMDKVLLSPGIPEDWGDILVVENSSQLYGFGLQKAGGFMYELDINKILRIVNVGNYQLPSTVRINYFRIAELLGLGSTYGFSMRIRPALNVSIHATQNTQGNKFISTVDVSVKTSDGRPAIGANVTVLYIFMMVKKQTVYSPNYTCVTTITGWDGKTPTIVFEKPVEAGFKPIPAAVVYAEYYGIRAINSTVLGDDTDALKGTIIGNHLIVDYDLEAAEVMGAPHLLRIVGMADPPYYVYFSPVVEAGYNPGEAGWVINRGAFNHRVFNVTGPIDDDVVFILLPVKKEGWPHARIVAFYRPPLDAGCQLGKVQGNIKTSVLRRMVKIGSFHYVFEVRVWRWGE